MNCFSLSASKIRYLSHVQLLWELIEHWTVARLVLFDNGGYKSYQLVPKFEVIQPRTGVLTVTLGLSRINLELSIVELVAVFEQELVRRSQAGFHAVFHHSGGSWRAGQFLHLKQKT